MNGDPCAPFIPNEFISIGFGAGHIRRFYDAFYGPSLGELTLHDPRRLVAALQNMWQPIETAPLQGRIMLYRPSSPFERAHVVIGWYNPDKDAARRPRPYWSHDLEAMTGTKEARRHPPTLWCPVFPPLITHET